MSQPNRGRRATGRVSGAVEARRRSAKVAQGGQRVSAGVVLMLILLSTAIALYDLRLLVALLAR